jgi:hypothetical protein
VRTGRPDLTPRIAVTGHRDLTERTAGLVTAAVRDALAPYGTAMVGISCLAAGADQIFARTVLDLGGTLQVIIAARGYRRTLPAAAATAFDDLLVEAHRIWSLPFDRPTPAAHAAANATMLRRADRLIAVWDGRPSRGVGGTAEAVTEARRRAIGVQVVWPRGAGRAGA